MLLPACHSLYVTVVMSLSRYDFSMDYKDISERIALLTQEIRDLQQINAPYPNQRDGHHRIDRASHEQRELRLRQIKEELWRMMLLARLRRGRVVLLRKAATVRMVQQRRTQ